MPLMYFGDPWDSPAVDAAIAGPTPLGESCASCVEEIEEGDQGVMVGTVREGPDDEPVAAVEPFHRECWIRLTVGSVEHLEGRCGTCTGGEVPDNSEAASIRQQGRDTMEWLRQHGQTA